jgi:hypothetical protein
LDDEKTAKDGNIINQEENQKPTLRPPAGSIRQIQRIGDDTLPVKKLQTQDKENENKDRPFYRLPLPEMASPRNDERKDGPEQGLSLSISLYLFTLFLFHFGIDTVFPHKETIAGKADRIPLNPTRKKLDTWRPTHGTTFRKVHPATENRDQAQKSQKMDRIDETIGQ